MNFAEGGCEKVNWIELAQWILVVGCDIGESLTLFFLSAMQPGTVEHIYGTVPSFGLFWAVEHIHGTVPSFCLFWVLLDLFFLFCFSALSFPSFEESQTKGNVQDIHSGVQYYQF
jgi:hypothetical protein